MRIVDSNQYGLIEEKELLIFEEKVGINLPPDYRQYLLKYNGGSPVPSDFNIPNHGMNSIDEMFGIHNGPKYLSLESNFETYKNRIPHGLLPIANDNFGNILCIGFLGEAKGQIYFWDHEECDDGDWSDIVRISDSFTSFLNSLFEYIDPDETLMDEIVRNTNINKLEDLLQSGFSLENEDEYGRTLIEKAAIAANNDLILYLHSKGAKLRNSLDLAIQNAKFFDEHKSTVELIKNKSGK
jgi:SMI1-KNR4 cell-wall